MTDRQLRDEVMTLLLAGHETTALALSWAWYLLAQHPEADATLAAELREVLGGRAPAVTTCRGCAHRARGHRGDAALSAGLSIGREALADARSAATRSPRGPR